MAYTFGDVLDHPLAVHRFEYRDSLFTRHDMVPATLSFNPLTIYPHTNWRGDYQTGTWTTRETQRCARVPANTEDYETLPDTPNNPGGVTVSQSWLHCLAAVKWPAKYIWLDHSTRAQPPGSDELWIGSLVYNKRDLTGNVYMRNRYYDAQAGRFSQEDPIGLAGGLNAYGFANGDPVSYSDPYGLSACLKIWRPECRMELAISAAGSYVGSSPMKEAQAAWERGNPRLLTLMFGPSHRADGVPYANNSISIGPLGTGGGGSAARIMSRIGEVPAFSRIASRLSGGLQAEADALVARLGQGNMNPGIGNRHLFSGIFEPGVLEEPECTSVTLRME